MVLPAVVLVVVYHYGYSAGRSAGIRTSSVMPQITSVPTLVPPASITSEARQPKMIETLADVQSLTINRVRRYRKVWLLIIIQFRRCLRFRARTERFFYLFKVVGNVYFPIK
jgi:hypothetical protein